MKLKLRTRDIEKFITVLSSINNIKKTYFFNFNSEKLLISHEKDRLDEGLRIWCKLELKSVFFDFEVVSLCNNQILLEINIDLFLQALKNFDNENSEELCIRLQKDGKTEAKRFGGKSRLGMLVFNYNSMSLNNNIITHSFKIPVRIVRIADHESLLAQPSIPKTDLLLRLPNNFSQTYKRLENFRKISAVEFVTIKASKEKQGFLGFVIESESNFKVTIIWNGSLEVRDNGSEPNTNTDFLIAGENDLPSHESLKEITVRLRDWQLSSKIFSTCKTILFMLNAKECILHCLLDESDDNEILCYIKGVQLYNPFV